jgi:hypothetical protein
MPGSRADVRETQLVQKLAHIAHIIIHTKAVLDHALNIKLSPAHQTIALKIRACLDQGCQFDLLQR